MGGEVREGRGTHSTPSGENRGMTSDNPKVQGLQNKQQTARKARRGDGEKQASHAPGGLSLMETSQTYPSFNRVWKLRTSRSHYEIHS